MEIIGIDIAESKFDVAFLIGNRIRQSTFANTEAGFQLLLAWLVRRCSAPSRSLHAYMEATGNWGLDLAHFLHAQGMRVSVVNPARIKAYGANELARNKTDQLLTPTSRLVGDPRQWGPNRPLLSGASASILETASTPSAQSCVNWSGAAMRSRLPACRNLTVRRLASLQPRWQHRSLPTSTGRAGRSRTWLPKSAISPGVTQCWPRILPCYALSPALARRRLLSC